MGTQMSLSFRYSSWDGSQGTESFDPDDLLSALGDDLLNFGDLQHALRNLMQRGVQTPQGDNLQGLRDMLQNLRQQRRDKLDQFDISSVVDELKEALEEVVQKEQEAVQESLDRTSAANADNSEPSDEIDPEEQERLNDLLESIAQKKQDFLDELPENQAGQIAALREYDFLSPEARERFEELLERLKEAMSSQMLDQLNESLKNMSPEDMERIKDMVRDLNDMMNDRMKGQEPNFDEFMDKHGDMFGENPPTSLDELMEQMQAQMSAMQSLMSSLPSDQQGQLQDMLNSSLGDPELQSELNELAENLSFLNPGNQGNQYPFRGSDNLTLEAATELMRQMNDMDSLEKSLERAQYRGEMDGVDLEKLREFLGDDAADEFEELQKLLDVLEEAGYIQSDGDEWRLTPRGTRMIGENALREIFRQLKLGTIGNHPVPENGRQGERLDESKPYEFGDPFHLDMKQTIMNALEREGRGSPVHLDPDDFEIYRSELQTTTATVLMVDLSWSMALRGSFIAAKKVALALQNLIKAQYPRDTFYVIGFNAYARELKPNELPFVSWDETVVGTNMHHALMLAEDILAKHTGSTKQILMVSDGEPTAHMENGRSRFSYPPSPVTIRETLKSVKRLTQKQVTINTFMLDRSHSLKEFVNQIAKLNGGRVFFSTPDQLGEYMLIDYVEHKTKQIGGRR